MLSLKDKVADKLSRLLADSPSPHSLDCSPVGRSEPHEAVSAYMEELFPTKKSTFSSFFLSFLPPTFYGSDEPNKSTRPLPFRSLPRRWKVNNFSLQDKPLDWSTDSRTDTESDSADEISKENLEDVPERNCNGYHGVEEACTSHDSRDFLSLLTEKSAFISEGLFEFFQSSLPNIVKGCKWVLLYSTLTHGISLQTLLRRSTNLSGPCLLIAGDMQGAIFGGLLDSPLKPTFKRKYQVKLCHPFSLTNYQFSLPNNPSVYFHFCQDHDSSHVFSNMEQVRHLFSHVMAREQVRHLFSLQFMASQGSSEQLVQIGFTTCA